MIARKGTKLYSIVKLKCPHCHEGQFLESHPYDFKKLGDVRSECEVCHIQYEREPGFYYGAMYVSYALGVALFVTVWTTCNLWFDWLTVWSQIGLVIFLR